MDAQSQLNVHNPEKELLETLCCSISWTFPANPTALSPSSVALKMGFNVAVTTLFEPTAAMWDLIHVLGLLAAH